MRGESREVGDPGEEAVREAREEQVGSRARKLGRAPCCQTRMPQELGSAEAEV